MNKDYSISSDYKIEIISGGVCAPQGFSAGGVRCGIRKSRTKKDLALIYSDVMCSAAGVYTKNKIQGAPIAVTKRNISDGRAQAVLCNSGNANTCNSDGESVAEEMCLLAAKGLGLRAEDIVIASTGVIGQPLPLEPIRAGMDPLIASLRRGEEGSLDAAEAIMTTDTRVKECAVSFDLGGKKCRIGGIAKGSGMIHPDMATMLVFITTDAAISPKMLEKALRADADRTFNMISVDGDTSTNDMVSVLANGMCGNWPVTEEDKAFDAFSAALEVVTTRLCREIAADGEGATKLLECRVSGAATEGAARAAAKAVISSSLVKSAMFGSDANWGRVLCAVGYSGADADPTKIDVAFSSGGKTLKVCGAGFGVPFDEEFAKQLLSGGEIVIEVGLNSGEFSATAWGCDLTYDYVKINGDYRT